MSALRLVVITMVQAKDFPAAWSSLRPLGSQLTEERQRIVLLNDDRDPALESALRSLPHTTVLAPGSNLGVARGRNTLFAAALATGADYVVSLDDDLYVPCDYLDTVDRVAAASDGTLGIFAPTVLDFAAFASDNPDLIDLETVIGGDLNSTTESRELRRRIDPADEGMFYHLGVRDWMAHYLQPSTAAGRAASDRLASVGFAQRPDPVATTFLRSDDGARAIAGVHGSDDRQPVDTLPGGVSVFSAAMLESIGLCDERFSPFGYEDADLCIRARQAGFHNAWVPSAVVLHDFLSRGSARTPEHLAFVYGRSKALLAANHLPNDSLATQIGYAVSSYPEDVLAVAQHRTGTALELEHQLASTAAFASGYLSGASAADKGKPALLDRLADVSAGHSLSTLRGRRWILHRLAMSSARTAPVLSGDVTVDEDGGVTTSATVNLRFPDGWTATFHSAFSGDPAAALETVRVQELSVCSAAEHTMDCASPALRRRDLSPDTRRTPRRSGRSILGEVVRPAVEPNLRQRATAIRIRPRPPLTLEELAATPLDTATGIATLSAWVSIQDAPHRTGAREDG